jgi:hypothetical protein
VIGWLLLALAAPAAPAVVTASAPLVSLGSGERGEVEIVARIRQGFRVQANPASTPFLVPARLELGGDERVEVGSPAYPPGQPYRLRGAAEDLSVYEGEIVIRVPLEARPAAGGAEPGESVLSGRLHYQACNERMCLRPSSALVEVRVSVRPDRREGKR